MLTELEPLIDKVWRYCEDKGSRGRTVTLKVKFADFELITRSRSLQRVFATREELHSLSVDLLKTLFLTQKAVRLLGVSISTFADELGPQMAFEL
jgi:DNA polymerase-4